jgi:hypothetical protein
MLNIASLNQRVNALASKINNIVPGGTQDLSTTLSNGNSAGAFDINMNSNDILSVDNINLVTINGSAYPPVVPADTLQAVLDAGNTATGANAEIVLTSGANVITIDPTATSALMKVEDSAGFFTSVEPNVVRLNRPIFSGNPADQLQITDQIVGYTIGLGNINTSWTNIINVANSGGSGTLQSVLTAGNTATGANATITLTDTDTGGQVNPILTLNNSNATGSVSMEVYKNKPTAGSGGDVLFNQSVYGKDTGNLKQEYTRTTHTIRDATGGLEDGSMEFGCFVNGAVATFLQLNGVENEVNCLKVLDMGGNNIRTTTGSLTITTAASTGTGTITIEPKSSSVLDIAGNATMTGTRNLFLGGGTNDTTFINNTQVKVRNNNLGNVIESTHSYSGFSSTDTTTGVSSNISNNALTLNGGTSTQLQLINTTGGSGTLSYTNTIDASPLQITSSTSLNLTTANDLILDGTNIISGSFGANSGQFLRILLNGTYYKIRLYND